MLVAGAVARGRSDGGGATARTSTTVAVVVAVAVAGPTSLGGVWVGAAEAVVGTAEGGGAEGAGVLVRWLAKVARANRHVATNTPAAPYASGPQWERLGATRVAASVTLVASVRVASSSPTDTSGR